MRFLLVLLLGAAIGLGGWWLIAHWGNWPWWAWFWVGNLTGICIGAPVTWFAVNVAFANEIGRAFGW